jgi:dystonin
VITLWQKKHLRMRQNMIFATIKVVKSWDFQQYISMEKEQRIAIRRALNEDSDKLIQVIFLQLIVVFESLVANS